MAKKKKSFTITKTSSDEPFPGDEDLAGVVDEAKAAGSEAREIPPPTHPGSKAVQHHENKSFRQYKRGGIV